MNYIMNYILKSDELKSFLGEKKSIVTTSFPVTEGLVYHWFSGRLFGKYRPHYFRCR